jgi:hypothetical protein
MIPMSGVAQYDRPPSATSGAGSTEGIYAHKGSRKCAPCIRPPSGKLNGGETSDRQIGKVVPSNPLKSDHTDKHFHHNFWRPDERKKRNTTTPCVRPPMAERGTRAPPPVGGVLRARGLLLLNAEGTRP